jgi:hypothetical protein
MISGKVMNDTTLSLGGIQFIVNTLARVVINDRLALISSVQTMSSTVKLVINPAVSRVMPSVKWKVQLISLRWKAFDFLR